MSNPAQHAKKINRNELCPCGSGRKYKQCCRPSEATKATEKSHVGSSSSTTLWKAALEHYNAGRLAEAEALCRQMLQIKPHQDALHLLGLIASAAGNHETGADFISEALKIKIHPLQERQIHPIMHYNLGYALAEQGKTAAAMDHYQKAIELKPNFADAHCNLGNLLLEQKNQIDIAAKHYRKALSIKPDYVEAHYNLGNALRDQGRLDEAIESYRKAILLKPDLADAHCNLGNALKESGHINPAVESYQKAIILKPDLADTYSNLGILLHEQNQLDTAFQCYHQSLALRPDDVKTLNSLGSALMERGQFDTAIETLQKAVSLDPNFIGAYNNLGLAYQRQGLSDTAIEYFYKSLSLKADDFVAYSNLIFGLSSYSQYSPEQYLAEARRYGDRVTALARPFTHERIGTTNQDARPLRVGFVSGDLLNHPVGYFLESILSFLNPDRIETVAYVTRPLEHELTTRIKPFFSAWNSIVGLSDESAARRIYNDGIDILVDLAGHTAHNRLPIFAWKPAPIQVSWLGYFASTGVPGMDYLLADSISVPESRHQYYTETIWYLPDTRLCFTPPTTDINVAPAPALRNGYLTFGCFQRLAKITDDVFRVWGRIFQALPQARLRMQNKQIEDSSMREQLLRRLAQVGIGSERVLIEGGVTRDEYLAAHAEIDVILDTFPFPGGATTCEALWMGIPTLTLAGNTMIARQGASLLACTGLSDWIANDEDEYVALALNHAADMNRLTQLRAGLRQRVLESPLFDARRFAVSLEEALWGMWEKSTYLKRKSY